MGLGTKIDKLHFRARQYKWLGYFSVFCRISLAAGFIPSGMQKVLGEKFTVLAVNHPMGNFLEAFYHTGYYYTFVGVLLVQCNGEEDISCYNFCGCIYDEGKSLEKCLEEFN